MWKIELVVLKIRESEGLLSLGRVRHSRERESDIRMSSFVLVLLTIVSQARALDATFSVCSVEFVPTRTGLTTARSLAESLPRLVLSPRLRKTHKPMGLRLLIKTYCCAHNWSTIRMIRRFASLFSMANTTMAQSDGECRIMNITASMRPPGGKAKGSVDVCRQ